MVLVYKYQSILQKSQNNSEGPLWWCLPPGDQQTVCREYEDRPKMPKVKKINFPNITSLKCMKWRISKVLSIEQEELTFTERKTVGISERHLGLRAVPRSLDIMSAGGKM